MPTTPRTPMSVEQRMEPCACCGYCPVQYHHVLRFSYYGQSEFVVPLCPNCHALYHLIESANRSGNKANQELLWRLLQAELNKEQRPFYERYAPLRQLEAFAHTLDTEIKRAGREMAKNMDRVQQLKRDGKTVEEINDEFEFLKNVSIEFPEILNRVRYDRGSGSAAGPEGAFARTGGQ